jgi:uncharacterized membrane protein YfcA
VDLLQIAATLAVGLFAGTVSGSLGVGGGAIMVPAMVLIFGIDQATAQGTSLLVILPTAVAGVISHFRRGSIDLDPTWLVGSTGAAAALGGSLLALHTSDARLRVFFAVFLLIVAWQSIFGKGRSHS